MRTPPLLADFIQSRVCKPKCEKLLTLPWNAGQFAKNINKILEKSGLKMKDVATVVNCTECISN